jgi:hypothetical protein
MLIQKVTLLFVAVVTERGDTVHQPVLPAHLARMG